MSRSINPELAHATADFQSWSVAVVRLFARLQKLAPPAERAYEEFKVVLFYACDGMPAWQEILLEGTRWHSEWRMKFATELEQHEDVAWKNLLLQADEALVRLRKSLGAEPLHPLTQRIAETRSQLCLSCGDDGCSNCVTEGEERRILRAFSTPATYDVLPREREELERAHSPVGRVPPRWLLNQVFCLGRVLARIAEDLQEYVTRHSPRCPYEGEFVRMAPGPTEVWFTNDDLLALNAWSERATAVAQRWPSVDREELEQLLPELTPPFVTDSARGPHSVWFWEDRIDALWRLEQHLPLPPVDDRWLLTFPLSSSLFAIVRGAVARISSVPRLLTEVSFS